MTQTIRNDPDSPSFNEPILHGLTEAEFVRDILSTEAFNPGLQQQLQGFETRILKRHLRKVIIDYTLRFKDSTRNYIGLYRESDERLGHTFSVMKTLRFNGFGEDSRLRVPSPIIYILALSSLMMKAASWLLPTLKSDIKSISDQLIGAQKSLHLHTKKPIHGDYHPRNIIVSPGLTTVIDFEETRMGDPAFDVGYFTAQTKMTHGLGDTTLQAVEAFVQEYRENMPYIEDDFAQRAAVFEAQTYLQRIYHTYYLLALRPDFDLISEWLNECQSCLLKARSGYPQTGRSKDS